MSSCMGKIRFPNHTKARRQAEKLERKQRGFAHPYRCESCNGYHLTAEPRGVSWQDKFRIIMGRRLG